MSEHYSEIEIVTLPSFKVVRCQVVSQTPEDDSNKKVSEWIEKQKFTNWKPRWFGFDVPVADALQKKGMRGYESWATVPEGAKGSEDIEEFDFIGGRYAYLLISDPFTDAFQTIPAGWQKMVDWLKTGPYTFDDRPCLEERVETATGPGLGIFLPIKE